MKRYLDAEKIKYHKLSVCGGHGLNFEYTVAYKHEVDAIPAADVVCRKDVIKAFEDYISEMTVSKYGTLQECNAARWAVKTAVDFVLGENPYCEDCAFYNEDRRDQPCCSCVGYSNFEKDTEGETDGHIERD